ncbi:MAG: hypothetical protein IPQ07_33845 [Myxococcales bacterium]|nr:hypothetical protein [Myxococcales bacterium]
MKVGRTALAGLVLAWAAPVGADGRKAAPDKFEKAAAAAFAQAISADDRGDREAAYRFYETAYQLVPAPETAFNMGELDERSGNVGRAIENYTRYLALAPKGADRKDVEARLARLRTGSVAVDVFTMSPTVDLADAYVLVDGAVVLRPGAVRRTDPTTARRSWDLPMTRGTHTVDILTPLTAAHGTAEVTEGTRPTMQFTAPARVDGAAFVSIGADGLDLRWKNQAVSAGRFAAPPGKHRLKVDDATFECAPHTLEVRSDGSVTYLFVTTTEGTRYSGGPKRCRNLVFREQRLVFKP